MSDEVVEQVILKIKRGDSKTYDLLFTDEDGQLIDITGWTIFFTAKTNIDDADASAVIKKDITEHTDPTAGESQIVLSSSDTNIAIAIYVFDIQVKTDLGEIKTILEGMLEISKDVTQRTS